MPSKINPDYIRLKDVLKASAEVQHFLTTASLDDRKTLMAVAYELAIIGEACANLSKELREQYSHVPWHAIVGMRHRIIHGYGKVVIERLQEAIEQLPDLDKEITIMLENIKE